MGSQAAVVRQARRTLSGPAGVPLGPLQPAQQVGALPWRRRDGELQILLVTSRASRRWLIPKGWPIRNLVDSNAAKQEAFEEGGVEGCIRREPMGRFTYVKRIGGGTRLCQVTVYPLLVQRELPDWPERLERARQWFDRVEAAGKVQEPELAALILDFTAP